MYVGVFLILVMIFSQLVFVFWLCFFFHHIVAFDIHIGKLFIFLLLLNICVKCIKISYSLSLWKKFSIFSTLCFLYLSHYHIWNLSLCKHESSFFYLFFLPELNIVVSKHICRIVHLPASDLKSCLRFTVYIFFYSINLCLHGFHNLSLYAVTNMLGRGLLLVFPFQNFNFMNLYVVFSFSWSK